MRGALCRCVALVAALSLVVPSSSFAQTTQAATTEFNAEQLNALLAPIALYPDEQLAQVPIDPVTYYLSLRFRFYYNPDKADLE